MRHTIKIFICFLIIMYPNLCFSEDGVDDNGWYFNEKETKLDGKKNIYYAKQSVDTLPNAIGNQEHGALIIRCVDNQTEAYIVWPSFIGLSEQQVKYKVDDNKINTETWSLSTDGCGAFASKPIKFLNSLKGAKTLIIQLDSYKQGQGELEFDLSGIDNYIDKIAECCHWNKKK